MIQIKNIGGKTADTQVTRRSQKEEKQPKSWAEYSLGLGKHTWKGVNIKKYIEDLRNEWG